MFMTVILIVPFSIMFSVSPNMSPSRSLIPKSKILLGLYLYHFCTLINNGTDVTSPDSSSFSSITVDRE